VGDGISTYLLIIKTHTVSIAGNPILRHVMNRLGPGQALFLFKGMAILLSLILLRWYRGTARFKYIIIALFIFYIAININNWTGVWMYYKNGL
jgi:hypothetical protein